MAIKNIPNINGPSYGGVIYSLNLSGGYSSSPSSLTLRIINETGNYTTPTLNQRVTISFGSFVFRGTVWSYSKKTDFGESTLEVEVRDNSIIMDRTYVVLWKRGLLGKSGSVYAGKKMVQLNESVLVPLFDGNNLKLRTVRLANQEISRERRSHKSRDGSYIILGQEDWPDASCDIPDTKYTFNELRGLLPFSSSGAPSSDLDQTYEGTLREVLNNWCSDLGYDFYWDYSSDRLIFYNVAYGMTRLPIGVKNPSITSVSESWSMDGSFAQYGVAYSAKPRSPYKEKSASAQKIVAFNVNPVHYSNFVNKSLRAYTTDENGSSVAGRSAKEVLEAALVGYASRLLRDLWVFTSYPLNKSLGLLGYTGKFFKLDLDKTLELLKINGYSEAVGGLEKVFGKGLKKHRAFLCSYNSETADKIADGEREVLNHVGRWYKMPEYSRQIFFCSDSATATIDISVDPEATVVEPSNDKFSGKKMFNRSPQVGGDILGLQDSLETSDSDAITNLQNCMPLGLPLKETGFGAALLQAKMMTENDLKKYNTLLLMPEQSLVKDLSGLTAKFSRKANPYESTYAEIENARQNSSAPECRDFERTLEASQCNSAKEEARSKAMREIDDQDTPDDLVAGLVNKQAYSCKINLGASGGSAEIFAPSDSQYRTVVRWSADVKQIDKTDSQEKIISSGRIGSADSVAEIRVNIDNATTSETAFGGTLKPPRTTPTVICGPQGSISYTFAGEPVGVPMTPGAGLTDLNITLGSDGFTSTVDYKTRAPKPPRADTVMRKANSQLNRASFNAN